MIIKIERKKSVYLYLFTIIRCKKCSATTIFRCNFCFDVAYISVNTVWRCVYVPNSYREKGFKLFVLDVGLLGCMAGLRQRTLLDGNDLFVEFKGALTEQYVCQQLKTIDDLGVYYYTNDRSSCEIDFIVDTGEKIIPVEAKAEINLKAKKLKTYQEKFKPKISVRTSMADFKKEDGLFNLPLYAIEKINEIFQRGRFID